MVVAVTLCQCARLSRRTTNAATAGVSRLSVEPAVFSNARGLGQYEKFTQPLLYIVKDKGQVKSFLLQGS